MSVLKATIVVFNKCFDLYVSEKQRNLMPSIYNFILFRTQLKATQLSS